MRSSRRLRLLLIAVSGTLMLLGLAPAGASSANISRSYQSSTPIKSGSIVSLDKERNDFVEASSVTNGSSLLGVAVAANDSLLAVDETAGKAQVATSGDAKTLVSTLNGDIKVGDQVAVSPFAGVGMKAVPGSRIVGLAQSSFNDSSDGASKQEVTDKNGKTKQLSIGYVSVSIAIGTKSSADTQQLSSLQKLGKSLTGHTVSTTRVLISLLTVIVSIVALTTLIYASIYGGIISIGRNPLARYAVFRTLGSVLGMVAIIAIISGVTVFLLLR